jgi:hypothetical protein
MAQSGNKKVAFVVRVGKEVGVLLGGRVLRALVVEDRGALGPGGAHLVRVEVRPRKNDVEREPEQFEVPVDVLVGAPA